MLSHPCFILSIYLIFICPQGPHLPTFLPQWFLLQASKPIALLSEVHKLLSQSISSILVLSDALAPFLQQDAKVITSCSLNVQHLGQCLKLGKVARRGRIDLKLSLSYTGLNKILSLTSYSVKYVLQKSHIALLLPPLITHLPLLIQCLSSWSSKFSEGGSNGLIH